MSGRHPLIKGYFAALRLIVGAVMSSACGCGSNYPGPDVVRWSFAPITLSRWMRSQCHGLWDQTALFASPLGHPRFLCSPWPL